MSLAVRDYCFGCFRPTAEVVVDGVCSRCSVDVFSPSNEAMRVRFRQDVRAIVGFVLECKAWGLHNDYPSVSAYPRYQDLRRLGENLHARGNIIAMGDMLDLLSIELDEHDDIDWNSSRFVEACWDGIGMWMF